MANMEDEQAAQVIFQIMGYAMEYKETPNLGCVLNDYLMPILEDPFKVNQYLTETQKRLFISGIENDIKRSFDDNDPLQSTALMFYRIAKRFHVVLEMFEQGEERLT